MQNLKEIGLELTREIAENHAILGNLTASIHCLQRAKRLSDLGAKRLSKILKGGKTSFLIMEWVRNVFPNYDLWAKRLSEIWFGCETSF